MTSVHPVTTQPQAGAVQPAQPAYQPMAPVVAQPGAGIAWIQPPPGFMPMPGCPPGLEYLSLVDQLMIKQAVHLVEVLLPFEAANQYDILNSMGQKVYDASEETDCLIRQCCGSKRPFTIHVRNNFQQEVLLLERPLKWAVVLCNYACLGRPCQDEVVIKTAPAGEEIGSLRHTCNPCCPRFTVYDEADTPIMYVRGPCFVALACEKCCDVTFKVIDTDEQRIGTIEKQSAGLLKELFTDADNFGVTFPMEMDVKQKATLLGAVFLLDFIFFEKKTESKA